MGEVGEGTKPGQVCVRSAMVASSSRDRALTWALPGRRHGLARGIYNRLAVDSRFPDRAILNEVQLRLNVVRSHDGPPAYQMVFGPNPVDTYTS